MDAINFSTQCWFGGCSGTGPWVQADLEWGLYSGGSQPGTPTSGLHQPIRHRNAEEQRDDAVRDQGRQRAVRQPTTLWDGPLPSGYSPAETGSHRAGKRWRLLQPGGGANLSAGTFYEGAMVSGYPSDATRTRCRQHRGRRLRARRRRPANTMIVGARRIAASTCRVLAPPTAPRFSCGTVTAAATSGGRTRRPGVAGLRQQVPGRAWGGPATAPRRSSGTATVEQPAVERQRQRHHHRRSNRTGLDATGSAPPTARGSTCVGNGGGNQQWSLRS